MYQHSERPYPFFLPLTAPLSFNFIRKLSSLSVSQLTKEVWSRAMQGRKWSTQCSGTCGHFFIANKMEASVSVKWAQSILNIVPVPIICVCCTTFYYYTFTPGEGKQLPMPNFFQQEGDVIFYPGILDYSNLFILQVWSLLVLVWLVIHIIMRDSEVEGVNFASKEGTGSFRTSRKGILLWFHLGILYIWLPGTSANCLQCLSLCLRGVCAYCF